MVVAVVAVVAGGVVVVAAVAGIRHPVRMIGFVEPLR